jgi:uncharacterized membrane protein YdbT with pleckstrin-like domain
MIPYSNDVFIPDEPDWVTLTTDEDILWAGRPSIYMLLHGILGDIAILVLGVISWMIDIGVISVDTILIDLLPLTLIAIISILIGLFSLIATLLYWLSIQYVVTSEEIYVKKGIVSRQAVNTRLDRVYNTEFQQSILGRILSFGDVQIQTAGTGGTDVRFRMVDNPGEKTGLITRERDEPGSSDPEKN